MGITMTNECEVMMLHLMSPEDRSVYLVTDVSADVRESYLVDLFDDERAEEEASMMRWMMSRTGGIIIPFNVTLSNRYLLSNCSLIAL